MEVYCAVDPFRGKFRCFPSHRDKQQRCACRILEKEVSELFTDKPRLRRERDMLGLEHLVEYFANEIGLRIN